jgi:hypothetical protein
MSRASRRSRAPFAIFVTLGMLFLAHTTLQEPNARWELMLPILLVMALGELTREFVVERARESSDDASRESRRRTAIWFATGALGCMVFLGASIAFDWIPRHSLWFFPPFVALILCLNVASALVQTDLHARARRDATARGYTPGPRARIAVFVCALLMLGIFNWSSYEWLAAGHALTTMQWGRLALSMVLGVLVVFQVWRHIDSATETMAEGHADLKDGL